jgi:hypothetical protein
MVIKLNHKGNIPIGYSSLDEYGHRWPVNIQIKHIYKVILYKTILYLSLAFGGLLIWLLSVFW